jgi:hypothetical protein
MPLVYGKSNNAVFRNISEMVKAGHPQDQAVAAALNIARSHKDDGGSKSEGADVTSYHKDHPLFRTAKAGGGFNQPREIMQARASRPAQFMPHTPESKLHVGPIHSQVAGRTDHLPMHVPAGSYVIPADIISAMGEGNTIAGFKHMRRMFGGTPYGGGSTPYGQSGGPYGAEMPHKAGGGSTDSVPIVAAGGEYVLSPDQVKMAGGGDLDIGHKVLDDWVKTMRKKTISTLQKLPGPKKD